MMSSNPKISFSDNLNETETNESSNLKVSILQPDNSDFDFCIPEINPNDLSPADELFSDGRILPLPLRNSIERRRIISENDQTRVENLMEQSPEREHTAVANNQYTPLKFLKKSFIWSFSFLFKNSPIESESEFGSGSRSGSGSRFGSNFNERPSQPNPMERKSQVKKQYENGIRVNPILNLSPYPDSAKESGSYFNERKSQPNPVKRKSQVKKQYENGIRVNPILDLSLYSDSLKESGSYLNERQSQPNPVEMKSPVKKQYGNGIRVNPILNLPKRTLSFFSKFGKNKNMSDCKACL